MEVTFLARNRVAGRVKGEGALCERPLVHYMPDSNVTCLTTMSTTGSGGTALRP